MSTTDILKSYTGSAPAQRGEAMEFGSALRVLLRRWVVVLLGAALTLFAAGIAYAATPPSYRATANLLLLLPSDAIAGVPATSPYLNLPSELSVLARVVAAPMASKTFEDGLEAEGLTASYEIGVDPRSAIIILGVEGPDPDNVLATRDAIVTAIELELSDVQREEGVPRKQTARVRAFGAEDTPSKLGGSAVRGVVAIMTAGGLLTLLAVFGIDRMLAGRRRESDLSESVPSEPAPTEPGPAPHFRSAFQIRDE